MFGLDQRKDGLIIGYLDLTLRQAQQNQEIKNRQEAKKFLKETWEKIRKMPLSEIREKLKKLRKGD